MKPEGSQPATIWSGVWRSGFESAVKAIRSEPGPISGQAAVELEVGAGRAVGVRRGAPVRAG